jgi:triacylglycerol esterase/lipase EstA (alpha/beta hydrolase family)
MEALGKRLAVELNNFFKNVEFGPGTRVSFVGHSMGGIIIRSALTYIRNLDQYLWAYLSFSSPHLGYLYEPSALVQAGLWLLNALQKS